MIGWYVLVSYRRIFPFCSATKSYSINTRRRKFLAYLDCKKIHTLSLYGKFPRRFVMLNNKNVSFWAWNSKLYIVLPCTSCTFLTFMTITIWFFQFFPSINYWEIFKFFRKCWYSVSNIVELNFKTKCAVNEKKTRVEMEKNSKREQYFLRIIHVPSHAFASAL